jgi:hypothetical protein
VLALCGILLLGFTRQAAAEWQITPMVGLTMLGSTTIFDPELGTGKRHWNLGGAVSLLSPSFFGAEVITTWTPGFFERDDLDIVDSSRSLSLMANVVVTTPRRWTEYSLRPFVSGGLGLMHVSKHDTTEGLFPVDLNLVGFNIGGGAVGFLTQRTGLRFDVRYHSLLNPSDQGPIAIEKDVHLRYVTASIGIVFRR